jgi:hypothetical protein
VRSFSAARGAASVPGVATASREVPGVVTATPEVPGDAKEEARPVRGRREGRGPALECGRGGRRAAWQGQGG